MKRIGIGTDDFRNFREGQFLYVDKSLFIREVLDGGKVLLLPRPRRFGKTLNMTMLQTFFDQNQDSRALFEGLAISRDPEAMTHLNAYPTIFISLKSLSALNWKDCEIKAKKVITQAFRSNRVLLEGLSFDREEAAILDAVYDINAPLQLLSDSLLRLTSWLYRATGKKVVLLIDEYDSPIHHGLKNGFFPEIIDFMRGFLGEALKGNAYLQFAVVTGILRVGKESIYSGLNNLSVFSILEESFSTCFGFSESEVTELLVEAKSPHPLSEVQAWYNGYTFGKTTIYNPWSILKVLESPRDGLTAHWIGTSGNELITDLIKHRSAINSDQLETLLRGEPVKCFIEDSVAMTDITPQSIWTLLLFSGYLTPEHYDSKTKTAQLRLPNLEIRSFFEATVLLWLGEPSSVLDLIDSLLELRLEDFARLLTESIQTILSYHDVGPNAKEETYHIFTVGLLAGLRNSYEVFSNRESGHGRYDLALMPRKKDQPGFIFEFKKATTKNLTQKAKEALAQIRTKDYTMTMRQAGVATIASIGLAFSGKWVALSGLIQKGTFQKVVNFGPDDTDNTPDSDLKEAFDRGFRSGSQSDLNPAIVLQETRSGPALSNGDDTQVGLSANEAFGPAAAQIEAAKTTSDSLPERGNLPPNSRMDHRPNPAFAGRFQDLLDLHQALCAKDKAVITPLVAATGMGGIGKTQLAIEFAYRYGRLYPGGVFWLDFADPTQVPSELVACGVQMQLFRFDDPSPQEVKVALVQQAWAQNPQKRLLIFDNCETEDLLDTWAPRSGPNQVLVTSRNQHWSPALGLQECRLGLLARKESIELLTALHPKLTAEQANAIATELGDLPLALYLAGSYLAYYNEDPVRYLAELPNQPLQHASLIGSKQRYQPTKHDTHVGRTIARSFERLDPQDPTDALARTLLLHAAQFAPGETIVEELLLATIEKDVHAKKEGLLRLVELGLIQKQDQTFTLHRLLHHFCQEAYPAEDQNLAETQVATAVVNLANKINDIGLPSRMAPLLIHLRYLSEPLFPQDTTLTVALALSIGYHLNAVSAWSEAERYYRRALAVSEMVHGPSHETTALCLNNLAGLLQATNRLADAEPLLRRALDILETSLGSDHPNTQIVSKSLDALVPLLAQRAPS